MVRAVPTVGCLLSPLRRSESSRDCRACACAGGLRTRRTLWCCCAAPMPCTALSPASSSLPVNRACTVTPRTNAHPLCVRASGKSGSAMDGLHQYNIATSNRLMAGAAPCDSPQLSLCAVTQAQFVMLGCCQASRTVARRTRRSVCCRTSPTPSNTTRRSRSPPW